jgi:hypothetical protein
MASEATVLLKPEICICNPICQGLHPHELQVSFPLDTVFFKNVQNNFKMSLAVTVVSKGLQNKNSVFYIININIS